MSAPLPYHEEAPARVLVVVAHPRDADLAMAGSVAGWIADGAVAELVCCTSGDGRANGDTTDPLELTAIREREQRQAAAVVGYSDVTFLHRPEGAVVNDLALRERLVWHIRTFRPDLVATHDPRVIVSDDGYVNHVDHRACGTAAIDAVSPAAANAMAFRSHLRYEGLQPHTVSRLCLFWSERPTARVDIEAMREVKGRALRTHASQPLSLPSEAWESFALIDLRS